MSVGDRLASAGQHRLAARLARLSGVDEARLREQVEALDIDLVGRLVGGLVEDDAHAGLGRVEPLAAQDVIPLPRTEADREREREARRAGEEALRAGRVAAVLLAGGQGTRLGFDGPKGAFPFSPITHTTLFAHHAAKIDALRRRYGAPLPWYVLTSPQNDAVTREFFAEHGHFGLAPQSVRFVVQGTLPAVDREDGSILLEAPDRLALSPDGHGGLLSALRVSGALDEMAAAGAETIFTFQVDNPMLSVCRPDFVGHHVGGEADMLTMVVRKLGPEERMGVIARIDGRTGVVEYSDLPDELAQQRDGEGELAYWAGSIAVHCIEIAFVRDLTEGGLRLPYHRAVKKVPHVRRRGPRRGAGRAQRREVRDLPLRRAAQREPHGERRGAPRGRVLADQERRGPRLAGHGPARPEPHLRALAGGGGGGGRPRRRRRAAGHRGRPALRARRRRAGRAARARPRRRRPDGHPAPAAP